MFKTLQIGVRWIAAIAIVLGVLAGATTVNADTVICADPCNSGALATAIAIAAAGDTIEVPAGTFTLDANVVVNKDVTIHGAGQGVSIFQISGTGSRISLTADGASLENFEIYKTDKTAQSPIIAIAANNLTLSNITVHGQWKQGDPETVRGLVTNVGKAGLTVEDSSFYNLRQPGYVDTNTGVTIRNTYVAATRGWVVDDADISFINNTWGTGAEVNAVDIAIIPGTTASYYPDILAISAANNNAVIEDQRTGVMTHVWVDDSSTATKDFGYRIAPYTSIQAGINRAVPGGFVNVAAGTYLENEAAYRDLVINKSIHLIGAGKDLTTVRLTEGKTNGVEIYGTGLDVAIERMTFTRREGSTYGPDFGLRIAETASTFTNFYMNEVAVLFAKGRGVQFGANATYTYINIEDCDFNNSGAWGMSIDGLTSKLDIARSTFMNNGSFDALHGIGLDIGNGGISNVSVIDTDFSSNTMKGVNLVNTTTALFQRIKVNNTGPAANNSAFTMWEWGGGAGSSNITVIDSEFLNNNRMAILLGSEAGNTISDVTIMSSIFAGNGQAAIFGWNDGTLSDIKIHHNSLLATGQAIFNNQPGTVYLAENNWFGCNEGPGQPGCSSVSTGVDADPWLVLKATSADTEVLPGGSTPITASLNFNNLGSDTSTAGRGFFPDGVTVNFTADPGTVDPTSDTTLDGEANTTFTSGTGTLPASVCAVLDNETTCVNVDVIIDVDIFLPVISYQP